MGAKRQDFRSEATKPGRVTRSPNDPRDLTAKAGASPCFSLHLFGPLEARLHGTPLPRLRTRKDLWLLALLALHAGRELDRTWVAGRMWPESSESGALANLRNSLKEFRRVLGPDADRLGSARSRTLGLEPSAVETDVEVFDAAVARGDDASLEQALALYRGPLLSECALEWAFQERQIREQALLHVLETLANRAVAAGDPGAAVGYLRRAVATDPLRESAHRALMQSLAAGGNHAGAVAVYRDLRLLLHREVNTAPDPETRSLYYQIQADVARRNERIREPQSRRAAVLSAAPPAASGRSPRSGCCWRRPGY
jgi:DNA-binding SARP family transcriptional activator